MIYLSIMGYLLRASFRSECADTCLIGLIQAPSTPASCSITRSMMRFGSAILRMERRSRIRPSYGIINIIPLLRQQVFLSEGPRLALYPEPAHRGPSPPLHRHVPLHSPRPEPPDRYHF